MQTASNQTHFVLPSFRHSQQMLARKSFNGKSLHVLKLNPSEEKKKVHNVDSFVETS